MPEGRSDVAAAAPGAPARPLRLERLIRRTMRAEVGMQLDELHRTVERLQEQMAMMTGVVAFGEHPARIAQLAGGLGVLAHDPADDKAIGGASATRNEIGDVFGATSFRDLTRRRIRHAIAHLRQVDLMLDDLGAAGGAKPAAERSGCAPGSRKDMVGTTGPDLLQVEIDRLMAF